MSIDKPDEPDYDHLPAGDELPFIFFYERKRSHSFSRGVLSAGCRFYADQCTDRLLCVAERKISYHDKSSLIIKPISLASQHFSFRYR